MAVARRNPLQPLAVLLRRHTRTLSGLALLGLLVLGGMATLHWMSDPQRFPLSVVEVKGAFHYLRKETLQAAVAPAVNGGFFTVDVAAIRAAAEHLPWVYRASVKRIWPATLRIVIVEQQPVAHWGEHGYLNAHGESFVPARPADTPALPMLSGPAGQENKVLDQYHRLVTTLAPVGLQVQQVVLDQRRAWRVTLEHGVVLRLGRAEPWRRLARLVRVWPELFAARVAELQAVDLRYSNGFSVLWQTLATGTGAGKPGQQG